MIGTILRIRYELIEQLDEDAMFTLYKARDRVAAKEVAIRTLQPPFDRETRFIEKLKEVIGKVATLHTGVERMIEVDEHEGSTFIVGDLAPGFTLEDRIRKLAPFSAPVAVNIAIGIAEALDACHRAGITHGDLAARNIVVSAAGAVKLRQVGLWESFSSSRTAGAVALPSMAPYLAPEISAGATVSPATDIYAVGILLFEMLTGRQPFVGDSPVVVAMKHSTAPVPNLRSINPSVPVVLEEIVRKTLAKEPEQRYPSAAALLRDLQALSDALRFGRPISWPIGSDRGPTKDAPQPVAPALNVANPRDKKPSRPSREVVEPDVPPWLMWAVYVCLGVLVITIGAWAFFNVNKKKLVKVPNVIGLSSNEASARLQDMGLTMKIAAAKPSEQFPEGAILETNPPPGAQVRSLVSVVISQGSKFVDVPDLRGRTLDDAKSLLANLQLELDSNVRTVRDRYIEAGKIVRQVPEPRKRVERYTRIRVEVSSGNRGAETSDPSEDKPSKYTIKIKMPLDQSAATVRVDITDSRETRTVYEEDHLPGDEFEVEAIGYGSSAIFRIFFDGELVMQKRADAVGSGP